MTVIKAPTNISGAGASGDKLQEEDSDWGKAMCFYMISQQSLLQNV